MEPAGLALGIAGLFNSVLTIVDGLSAFRSCDDDVWSFSVLVKADYLRLRDWGREAGLYSGDNSEGRHHLDPRLNDPEIAATVRNLLTLAIETFGEAKEIMQKHKSKTGFPRSLRSLSFTLSSRQVEDKLRRSSRSWSFGSKQKTLGEAVGMGLFAAQYGKPIHNRMFSTKKATRITRTKWAFFRKSQAQELRQKLKDFIDELVALVPMQGNNAPQNVENPSTDKSVTDDGGTSLEGLCTDGFVTDCGETGLDGLDSIDGGASKVIHSVDSRRISLDSRRKLKCRKARKWRIQYSSRQGVKNTTGRVVRINRDRHIENVLLGLYGAKMAAYGSAAGSLVFFFHPRNSEKLNVVCMVSAT
ncbi:prion-inhibition and propagation-domain-containing protein [Pyronema omphalodes]|nr:prion-inhibition and propagation-domain-containing protein [Pyronema omphalodes]